MIDLVAQGPVYRGHKLARIVGEYSDAAYEGHVVQVAGYHVPGVTYKPVSTKAWARLDIRVIGNPWGLSVSDAPHEGYEVWEAYRGYVD